VSADTPRGRPAPKSRGGIGETLRTLVYALRIALAIRTVAFEPFSIPSGSMIPTLVIGDYLFVSKYAYGYSRYSMPFSPGIFSGRIVGGAPERGDVVVFRHPRDRTTDLIKRVIGLPGDRIQVRGGVLYINDAAVPRERIADLVATGPGGSQLRLPQYVETLPNGRRYRTLDLTPTGGLDDTDVYVVRDGHYFMMGDNRDNSNDSRVTADIGQVPAEFLIGRAEIMFFSIGEGAGLWQIWKWPTAVRWQRLLKSVQEY